jgi:hypothetical protein
MQVVLAMLALTQETQLLWFSQVSGTGVTVGCGADGPSVVTFPEGPKVVCPVTVGARVELASTDSAQNATRQVTAQNSRREDPDMVSSALASR